MIELLRMYMFDRSAWGSGLVLRDLGPLGSRFVLHLMVRTRLRDAACRGRDVMARSGGRCLEISSIRISSS